MTGDKTAKLERAAALARVLHTMRAAELLQHAMKTGDPDDFAEAERYLQAHGVNEADAGTALSPQAKVLVEQADQLVREAEKDLSPAHARAVLEQAKRLYAEALELQKAAAGLKVGHDH